MAVHFSRTAATVSFSSDLVLIDVDICGERRADEESGVAGVGPGGTSLHAASDECIVRNERDVAVGLGLRGSSSRPHGDLHHPSLDSLRVSFVQIAVECAACLVSDGDHVWIDVIGEHGAIIKGQLVASEWWKEHEILVEPQVLEEYLAKYESWPVVRVNNVSDGIKLVLRNGAV